MMTERMSHNEPLRTAAALTLLVTYSVLAILMIIALLSGWPPQLHRTRDRLCDGTAIDNHDLSVHEAVAIADHESRILCQLIRPSQPPG